MVGDDGVALVEFTVFAPLLVVAGIYIMDFGLYLYNNMVLQNVAQAGAQWAITNRTYNSADIGVAAAQNNKTIPPITITVNSNYFCGCPSSSSPFVTQIASGACSSIGTPCSGSSSIANTAQGNYLTVTASATYPSWIAFGLFGSSNALSETSTVRIQ